MSSKTRGSWDVFGGDRPRVRENLVRMLDASRIAGVDVEIRPDCDPVFGDEPEMPFVTRPLADRFVAADFCITPESWLELTAENFNQTSRGPPPDIPSDYQYSDERPRIAIGLSESSVEWIESALTDQDETVPLPHIELDADGEFTGNQEGRNRGFVAREMGFEWINVRIVLNATK